MGESAGGRASEPEAVSSAAENPRPRYTLRPVVKPLKSDRLHGTASGRGFARAETEDDDGYDPYSDYHDGTAGPVTFEADPWR